MHDDQPKKPRVPRGLLLIAVLAGFGVSFGIAAAIGDDEDAGDDHKGGPTGERVMVASGTTGGEIGRWRIWRSVDVDGRECIEAQLLDDKLSDSVPDSARAPDALPVPDGGALSGGCGSTADLDVVSVSASTETLLVGRAPEGAENVDVTAQGRGAKRVKTQRGPESVRFTFFGAALEGRPKGVKVTARDKDGKELRSKDVPTPGG
jgi:hypothetical protein